MTALTIPQEVATDCAQKLLALAATASRDAMTLTKQAMALAGNQMPSRPLATLRKYVREYNQYESGEVAKIIAAIEEAADPEHVRRLARNQAKYDAQRAVFEKRNEEALPQAHALMREQEASQDLIAAVLDFHEGTGDLWTIEANLPGGGFDLARREGHAYWEAKEAAKHQGGNVVAGPWDAAGGLPS